MGRIGDLKSCAPLSSLPPACTLFTPALTTPVRETCHFLIDQLTPDDYLGIVSYSGGVRADVPLLRMTPAARGLAHAMVDALEADGSTALYDGLVAGVRQQMEAEVEMKKLLGAAAAGGGGASRLVHSCFLFTDGEATDGEFPLAHMKHEALWFPALLVRVCLILLKLGKQTSKLTCNPVPSPPQALATPPPS